MVEPSVSLFVQTLANNKATRSFNASLPAKAAPWKSAQGRTPVHTFYRPHARPDLPWMLPTF